MVGSLLSSYKMRERERERGVNMDRLRIKDRVKRVFYMHLREQKRRLGGWID